MIHDTFPLFQSNQFPYLIIKLFITSMGSQASRQFQKVQLRVATLNYSGILKSPYEFYEKKDEAEESLSKNMEQTFEAYKGKFGFDFGPFDREWQETRYSPLYVPTCGIKNNVHLMSRKQFEQEWVRWRDRSQQSLEIIYLEQKKKRMDKEKKSDKPKQKFLDKDFYLENLKTFDFLIYKTILQEIYTTDVEKNQLHNNFEKFSDKFQLSSLKYKENRKEKFRKPFLDENKKIEVTIKAIHELNLDILFLQEANLKLVQAIEQRSKTLRIVKSTIDNSDQLASQSVIIIRENPQKFPKFNSLIEENTRLTNNITQLKNPNTKHKVLTVEQIKQLNFNSDTVVQFLYNIILICPHLSSKPEKNQPQVEQIKKKLAFLKEKFPDCHIIVAGDLNNNQIQRFETTDSENQKYYFNVVPDTNKKQHFTAHKMRTTLQAQPTKANKPINQVKDYIISDLKIQKAQIQTVKQVVFDCFKEGSVKKEKQMPLLPSESHPYDHYMLTATIIIENGLQHVTDAQYRLRYKPESLHITEQEKIIQLQKNIESKREKERARVKQMKTDFQQWVKLTKKVQVEGQKKSNDK